MAKKKVPTSNGLFTEFKTLSEVGLNRYYIDTGNLALNYICSGRFITGGIPGGKITEVYGPPSSSKSLLAMCCLAGCQKMGGIAVHLDCERAANPDFAEKAGHVNVNQLILFEPISIEDVERKIIMATKKIRAKMGPDVPILFTFDSIGVVPTEREWAETKLPETYTKEEFKKIVGSLEKPGERARAAGDMLRKINPYLDENNATLFIINQVRQAIGVRNPAFSEIPAGGGKALAFYASLRLRTSAFKNIVDKNKVPLGVNLKFTNKKNRSFTPFMSCENIHLYFSKGINPVGGLLTIMIQSGRIKAIGKGRYQVEEPYADGQDVKFTATKAEDLMPLDILYQCPKIIDAKDQKQVEDYLGVFAQAIQLSASGATAEVDVDDDDESAVDKLEIDLESEGFDFDGEEE